MIDPFGDIDKDNDYNNLINTDDGHFHRLHKSEIDFVKCKLKIYFHKNIFSLVNKINNDSEVINNIISINYKFPRQNGKAPVYAIVYYKSIKFE